MLTQSNENLPPRFEAPAAFDAPDDLKLAALQVSESRYRRLFEAARDGILLLNFDTGRIEDVNPYLVELLGYTHAEFLGKALWEVGPFADRGESREMFAKLQLTGYVRYDDLPMKTKAGEEVPVEFVSNAYDCAGVKVIQCNIRNISERKLMGAQLRHMAFYDTLTNLPNRRLLDDRLEQAMGVSRRSGRYGVMMFLDLDDFKRLNDRHGHAVGDLLLMQAAARLKCVVRETDTVARFGGDEFVVLIGELDADRVAARSQAEVLAGKIHAALGMAYALRVPHAGALETTIEYRCTASIGVALFSDRDAASQDELLKRADAAMYRAKQAGCNLVRFFDSTT